MPDDLAVELLVPLVAGACRVDPTATWTLVPRGGEPIPGEETLRGAAVWQGAILTLRQTAGGERRPARRHQEPAGPVWPAAVPAVPAPPPAPPPAAPVSPPPPPPPPALEQVPPAQRLGQALGAARTRRWPGEGRLARARAAWRDTGQVARLEARIAAAPRRRGVVIGVVSLRNGCGKTTVATLLASLLARTRTQPPLVVDGDLASRALSRQFAPTFRMPSATYADVVERRLRLADLRPAPIGPGGIRVLPAPDHPAVAPDEGDCAALIAELRTRWGVTVLDCAAGFQTAWSRAAWAEADQFVLVAEDRPDELAALEPVAAKLTESGAGVAVIANRARAARNPSALPDDPVAAALLRGGELAWDAAPEPWRCAVASALDALAARW